ncbi:MAG: SH3 domain-containing protein, partial [Myxococcales bacterium]|nr:SH3 domain-containing protein [Myxococcales bacterium]
RAVLIGQPTYGKDTVQVLYEIDEDDKHPSDDRVAALKLTIRRYLLAGARSIGQSGIQPDIRTDNVSIGRRRLRLSQALRHPLREGHDFEGMDRPIFVYRSFHDQPYVDDDAKLAHRLLEAVGNVDRTRFLKAAAPLIHELQQAVRQKLVAALSRQGVDWTEGTNPVSPQVRLDLYFEGGPTRLVAGRRTNLVARLRNVGRQPLYRLYGVTRSSGDLFDQLDFAFGMIRAGETKTWRVPVVIPRSIEARHEQLMLRIYGPKHGLVATRTLFARVRPTAGPRFGYQCQPTDPHGNGDGRIQTGESVVLLCLVQNLGRGASARTLASIRNRSGDGVLIRSGLQRISALAPGASTIVRFTFDVTRDFRKDDVRLKLRLYDRESDVELSDRLHFTVERNGREVQQTTARMAEVTAPRIDVYASADEDGPPLGTLAKGSHVRVDRRVDGWVRVELDGGRHGWVHARGLRLLSGAPNTLPNPIFVPKLRSNPMIELLPRHRPPTLTSNSEIMLRGRLRALSDDERLHDMYVYHNSRKIYFKHAWSRAKDGWVYFDCPVKLVPGANRLVIVGRQDELLTRALRVSIFRVSR